jgi:hypothetical protein
LAKNLELARSAGVQATEACQKEEVFASIEAGLPKEFHCNCAYEGGRFNPKRRQQLLEILDRLTGVR